MFISSYNTYINTITSKKNTHKIKDEELPQERFQVYSSKNIQLIQPKFSTKIQSSVDYIAKSNAFHNKLLIEFQQRKDKLKKENKSILTADRLLKKFSKKNSMQNVSMVYIQNSKKYTPMKKPSQTFDKISNVTFQNSLELQAAKEKNLRHIMVNTYLQNDKFYTMSA